MAMVRVTRTADGRLVRGHGGMEETVVHVVDLDRIDRTTEAEIARHQAEDDAVARQDAAAYARRVRRRVRRRVGPSQAAFAARIGVPLDTVRNWEQGKRAPAGPARALLRVLNREPEAVRAALDCV